MAGNRVDELESKVRELEATVSGLTDELLETKERLRAVEDHAGVDLDAAVEGRAGRSATSYEEPVAAAREEGSRGPASQEKVEQAVERAADGEGAADEAKGNEAEGEDDDSGTDDIIVA